MRLLSSPKRGNRGGGSPGDAGVPGSPRWLRLARRSAEGVARLAALGQFEQALRIADETIARTSRLPGRGGRAGLNARISRIAELAREEILALRRQAQAAGTDLTDPQAMREQRDQRLRDVKEGSSSQPPRPRKRPWSGAAPRSYRWRLRSTRSSRSSWNGLELIPG